jgi:hypothetical protein
VEIVKIYSRLIATLFAKSILEKNSSGNDSDTDNTTGQIVFALYCDFPKTGRTETLYIATDIKEAYIWNERKQVYEKIGCNTDTDIIQ